MNAAGSRAAVLTPRQRRFVAEYLIDLNGKQAAIRAGYAPKSAEGSACELLRLPKVATAVARGQQRRQERTEVTQDRVVQELARIAFSDVRELFDERGRLLDPSELPRHVAAAIASIEVVRERGSGGDPIHKVKVWDKVRALELLGKHLGIFKELGDKDRPMAVAVMFGGRYKPAAGGPA